LVTPEMLSLAAPENSVQATYPGDEIYGNFPPPWAVRGGDPSRVSKPPHGWTGMEHLLTRNGEHLKDHNAGLGACCKVSPSGLPMGKVTYDMEARCSNCDVEIPAQTEFYRSSRVSFEFPDGTADKQAFEAYKQCQKCYFSPPSKVYGTSPTDFPCYVIDQKGWYCRLCSKNIAERSAIPEIDVWKHGQEILHTKKHLKFRENCPFEKNSMCWGSIAAYEDCRHVTPAIPIIKTEAQPYHILPQPSQLCALLVMQGKTHWGNYQLEHRDLKDLKSIWIRQMASRKGVDWPLRAAVSDEVVLAAFGKWIELRGLQTKVSTGPDPEYTVESKGRKCKVYTFLTRKEGIKERWAKACHMRDIHRDKNDLQEIVTRHGTNPYALWDIIENGPKASQHWEFGHEILTGYPGVYTSSNYTCVEEYVSLSRWFGPDSGYHGVSLSYFANQKDAIHYKSGGNNVQWVWNPKDITFAAVHLFVNGGGFKSQGRADRIHPVWEAIPAGKERPEQVIISQSGRLELNPVPKVEKYQHVIADLCQPLTPGPEVEDVSSAQGYQPEEIDEDMPQVKVSVPPEKPRRGVDAEQSKVYSAGVGGGLDIAASSGGFVGLKPQAESVIQPEPEVSDSLPIAPRRRTQPVGDEQKANDAFPPPMPARKR